MTDPRYIRIASQGQPKVVRTFLPPPLPLVTRLTKGLMAGPDKRRLDDLMAGALVVDGYGDGLAGHDDTAAILDAVDRVTTSGNNAICFQRKHRVSAPILLPGDFLVDGFRSSITWDGGDEPVIAQKDYASPDLGGNGGIILRNFTIDDNATVSRLNSWTVDLSNGVDNWAVFVEIQGRTTGAPLSDLFGILMGRKQGSAYAGNVWENHLERVNLRRAKAWICDSDGSVVNCQLHGISRDYALRIGAANRIIATYILGGETFGGLYISSTDNSEIFGAEILGCHFDGTVRRQVPHSIFSPAAQKVTGLIIEGGTARYNDAEAIRLENAESCKIEGMNCDACDARDEGKPDITVIGSTDGSWNQVAGNTHNRGLQATKTGVDHDASATRVNLGFAVEMTGKDDMLIPGTVSDNYRSKFFDNGTNPTARRKFGRFDDFDGNALNSEWTTSKGSDGAAVVATPVSASGGAVRLSFGAGSPSDFAHNHSQLYRQLSWRSFATGLVIEAVITPSSVGSQAWFFGLTAQTFSDKLPFTINAGGAAVSNCSDGCGFVFDTAGPLATLQLVGVKADVDAAIQDSGFSFTAGTTFRLRIEFTVGGAASFFINGAFVGSVMSAAMTATALLTPYLGGFSRSTTGKSIDADYIWIEQNRE